MMEATVARDERARRLAAIGRGLTYARTLDEMLEMTLDCATDLLGADRAAVLLTDADGRLRARASRGIDRGAADAFAEPLHESLLGQLTDLFGAQDRMSMLAVPLVIEGTVVGLLAVHRDADPSNDDEEEWLLSALADQAALAVESTHHRELRRELESKLGRLERERRDKDHALEILSHDLRSPLNAIQGYAALLSAQILGDVNERQQDALRKVRRISEHVTAILGNVLEMARLTSGRIELVTVSVELESVVADAVDIVRPAADAAGIALETRAIASVPMRTDPSRLRQVIAQLLENAVKYSPDGSRVLIEYGPGEPGMAQVTVTDQGPGIPADRREQIFEPYVRHDGLATRGHAGVGLGLSIARGIIERLGGMITVEDAAGGGSTFRLRLPVTGEPG